jgi:hypothetical protein
VSRCCPSITSSADRLEVWFKPFSTYTTEPRKCAETKSLSPARITSSHNCRHTLSVQPYVR